MAVISVEIPDSKAKNIKTGVISFEDLDELMSDTYETLIDFWPDWMTKEDFEDYKSRR